MASSKIEWTEATWNPVTGCTKYSSGCLNCYAARMAKRLKAMGQPNYRNGFKVTCHPQMLSLPLKWRKPRMIFVNSMSDMFHADVPFDFIRRVFDVMAQAEQHTFQVLTKRAERLAQLAPKLSWPENVWMGVTVENADHLHRIDALRTIPAHVRFLSLEPLLGPLPKLKLKDIHWVIVGGESGPGARPMDPVWVKDIRDRCLHAGVPFFFKQWGGVRKNKAGRLLDGRTWDDMPSTALNKSGQPGGCTVKKLAIEKVKHFHQYSKVEITEKHANPKLNYYVLSLDYMYQAGGCGGQVTEIQAFPHMVAALEHQLEWLKNFDEDSFGSRKYRRKYKAIEKTIEIIKGNGTDKGIPPSCLSICAGGIGYFTLACGYWPDFVRPALKVFAEDIQNRIKDEDYDYGKKTISAWKKEISRIQKLQKEKDTQSPAFVKEFFKLAGSFEQRADSGLLPVLGT